jgi:hypothetical protein
VLASRGILELVRAPGAVWICACFATACPAQRWETGAGAGYGIYRNGSVYAPAGVAAAGVRSRFAVTAVFGEDLYRHVSGEFRYTYQDGDPFLEAGPAKANVQGQSHAFHYDILLHARARGERLRPFLAAGIGAKFFRVTGPENPNQALGDIARLKENDEFRPLVTGGGGVKLRIAGSLVLRLDFRDYITPFPKKVIQPAPSGTARGILQQFTPMVGLSVVM